MSDLCKEKVALVTGGARGIGRAIALLLAKEGARVMICDILDRERAETVAMIRDAGGQATDMHCDITDSDAVQAAIVATVSTFGKIDNLVNNAAMGSGNLPFVEIEDEFFKRMMVTNLQGIFLFLKYGIIQMLKQGNGGSIVNISSVGGVVGTAELAPYNMTKHGVVGLTRALGVEYAKDEIRINAVCPGPIETPMLEEYVKKMNLSSMDEIAEHQNVPLGRVGRPQEVAEAVVWLCSDRSSYTTGSLVFVDGGYTAK